MKKIALKIEGKEYEISLEEEFADYVQKELDQGKLDTKTIKNLLQAYLRKSYECFKLQKKLNELIKKIEP
ncbi:hypothetical protein [Nitratiruptor sp. SB155-2]|uniref:hypothetical protein n=1 Tax=Nitratiruptor sp. (strain SB155-2) TaxID=387092 RepID=UPI0001586E12|nr:hypothetical protein [Nitratiruptor sp. SB155-2]BAF69446.1 conserved hypothetical protein [Nitratiruptor sp. SB155-2]